eukprot:m.53805 g.53805  ORF g.53805 m.53805 type:complete len:167 (-) comp9167_c0_seq1:66-566(-)
MRRITGTSESVAVAALPSGRLKIASFLPFRLNHRLRLPFLDPLDVSRGEALAVLSVSSVLSLRRPHFPFDLLAACGDEAPPASGDVTRLGTASFFGIVERPVDCSLRTRIDYDSWHLQRIQAGRYQFMQQPVRAAAAAQNSRERSKFAAETASPRTDHKDQSARLN